MIVRDSYIGRAPPPFPICQKLLRLGLGSKGSLMSVAVAASFHQNSNPRSGSGKEDKAKRVESLWHDFFASPSDWLDNRLTKRSKESPDFVHGLTKEALWIDGRFNPLWVEKELTLLDEAPNVRAICHSTSVNHGVSSESCSRSFEELRNFCEKGHYDEALKAMHLLSEQGIRLPTIFAFLIQDCTSRKDLLAARAVDYLVIKSGFAPQSYWGSRLIRLFAACGNLPDACRIFKRIPKPSALAWAAVIAAHASLEQFEVALELYEKMLHSMVKPNERVFIAVLTACTRTISLLLGRIVHCHSVQCGCESDVYVGSCLMEMYAVCGSIKDAGIVFDKLAKHDVVSWTTMIAGYICHGYNEEALRLFRSMQQQNVESNAVTLVSILKVCSTLGAVAQGKLVHAWVVQCQFESDMHVKNSLIDMYVKFGLLKDAQRVYGRTPKQDSVMQSLMIAGCVQNHQPEETLQYFNQIQQLGMNTNSVTIVSILQACSNAGALCCGKLVHLDMIESSFEMDAFVFSTLIDMYAKCGCIEDACKMFDASPKQNVVIWTAMIAGYTLNGYHMVALQHFIAMQRLGLEPDEVTFLSALSACSHMGLLGKGTHIFQLMRGAYGIMPLLAHYTCMIDLFGRVGCLLEAQDLVQTMPFSSDIEGWVSLLGNSKTYGDKDLGKECFGAISCLEPAHGSGYVLMSNILHNANMCKDAIKVKGLKESVYATKTPGKALIEISTNVHEFIVGDKTHSQSAQFVAKLSRINFRVKEDGYVPSMEP